MKRLLAAAVLGLATAGHANAGLLGQTMTATYRVPTINDIYTNATWTPPTFTVGSGQETDGNVEGVTDLLVDFSDHTLTITLATVLSSPRWNSALFNGPVFTAATDLGIGGASVDPATTMAGFDDSRVSFTNDTISINWQGLSYRDGNVVKVDFTDVPEPVSLTMMMTGLLGVGLVRYRRR